MKDDAGRWTRAIAIASPVLVACVLTATVAISQEGPPEGRRAASRPADLEGKEYGGRVPPDRPASGPPDYVFSWFIVEGEVVDRRVIWAHEEPGAVYSSDSEVRREERAALSFDTLLGVWEVAVTRWQPHPDSAYETPADRRLEVSEEGRIVLKWGLRESPDGRTSDTWSSESWGSEEFEELAPGGRYKFLVWDNGYGHFNSHYFVADYEPV